MSENPSAEQYGPWASIAGASEGEGAALEPAVAVRGVKLVLLFRRQKVLVKVAASIRAETGVEARAVSIELSAAPVDSIARVTEVGDRPAHVLRGRRRHLRTVPREASAIARPARLLGPPAALPSLRSCHA
jgi:hypothetical protein